MGTFISNSMLSISKFDFFFFVQTLLLRSYSGLRLEPCTREFSIYVTLISDAEMIDISGEGEIPKPKL